MKFECLNYFTQKVHILILIYDYANTNSPNLFIAHIVISSVRHLDLNNLDNDDNNNDTDLGI